MLPRPKLRNGTSVSDALKQRKTIREIGSRKLPAQLLSNVLFAASGVNRRRGPFGTPGLTAASASNSQEVELYVLLEDGAYRFAPEGHHLARVAKDDLRRLAFTPGQPLISPDAPVQLVYVVDLGRLEHTKGYEEPGLHEPETQKSYYYVDTGLIAGNVYLFAAAQGLACWFHNCDRAALGKKLHLRKGERALFAQTVGYPSRGVS